MSKTQKKVDSLSFIGNGAYVGCSPLTPKCGFTILQKNMHVIKVKKPGQREIITARGKVNT